MSGDVINFKKIRVLCASRGNFIHLHKTTYYGDMSFMVLKENGSYKLCHTTDQGENSVPQYILT